MVKIKHVKRKISELFHNTRQDQLPYKAGSEPLTNVQVVVEKELDSELERLNDFDFGFQTWNKQQNGIQSIHDGSEQNNQPASKPPVKLQKSEHQHKLHRTKSESRKSSLSRSPSLSRAISSMKRIRSQHELYNPDAPPVPVDQHPNPELKYATVTYSSSKNKPPQPHSSQEKPHRALSVPQASCPQKPQDATPASISLIASVDSAPGATTRDTLLSPDSSMNSVWECGALPALSCMSGRENPRRLSKRKPRTRQPLSDISAEAAELQKQAGVSRGDASGVVRVSSGSGVTDAYGLKGRERGSLGSPFHEEFSECIESIPEGWQGPATQLDYGEDATQRLPLRLHYFQPGERPGSSMENYQPYPHVEADHIMSAHDEILDMGPELQHPASPCPGEIGCSGGLPAETFERVPSTSPAQDSRARPTTISPHYSLSPIYMQPNWTRHVWEEIPTETTYPLAQTQALSRSSTSSLDSFITARSVPLTEYPSPTPPSSDPQDDSAGPLDDPTSTSLHCPHLAHPHSPSNKATTKSNTTLTQPPTAPARIYPRSILKQAETYDIDVMRKPAGAWRPGAKETGSTLLYTSSSGTGEGGRDSVSQTRTFSARYACAKGEVCPCRECTSYVAFPSTKYIRER